MLESLEAGRKRKPTPTGSYPVWAGQGAIWVASLPLLASWGPPALKPKRKKWAGEDAHLPTLCMAASPVLLLPLSPSCGVSEVLHWLSHPVQMKSPAGGSVLLPEASFQVWPLCQACPRPRLERLGLCPSLWPPGSGPPPDSSQAHSLVLASLPPLLSQSQPHLSPALVTT